MYKVGDYIRYHCYFLYDPRFPKMWFYARIKRIISRGFTIFIYVSEGGFITDNTEEYTIEIVSKEEYLANKILTQ